MTTSSGGGVVVLVGGDVVANAMAVEETMTDVVGYLSTAFMST